MLDVVVIWNGIVLWNEVYFFYLVYVGGINGFFVCEGVGIEIFDWEFELFFGDGEYDVEE